MEFRTLGRTGLKVSSICLGTMNMGEQNTETEGHEQMDYALERGINFFDTAELYPVPPKAETVGRTEERQLLLGHSVPRQVDDAGDVVRLAGGAQRELQPA